MCIPWLSFAQQKIKRFEINFETFLSSPFCAVKPKNLVQKYQTHTRLLFLVESLSEIQGY
jgi:hypothetical protein